MACSEERTRHNDSARRQRRRRRGLAFAPGAAKLPPSDRASLQTLGSQAADSTIDPGLKSEFTQFGAPIAPAGS
jgi:hypothetical protein